MLLHEELRGFEGFTSTTSLQVLDRLTRASFGGFRLRGKVALRHRTLPSTQEERVAYYTTFTLHSHYIGGGSKNVRFHHHCPLTFGFQLGP